ncbi:MAG: indolepyruvate ferredoxin oxidoreductase subunit alpha [Tissierellales bacterium]|nr:indolepyruvate ferredoxin oxidoreductase subunit alpha [Tissierellales bacterium]MBN2826427.1 indolepyruvate ferredoxin oxidoreductase subunit alpha [Tissierellales bacterium]
MKKLLSGNEAIARGVYEAGVTVASAYPGTPSTEILENIATYTEDIYAEWASNEKVALETAIGASVVGSRAIASMKHVGLNVAADPFFTYAYMGVNGGLVVVTADEPGMHSSQNEQDNRHYARHAKVPMFEPANSQEAKDMIVEAYEVSEKYDAPVLFRITTRVAHSKDIVELGSRKGPVYKKYEKNIKKNVPVPAYSRLMRDKVETRMIALADYAHHSPLNFEEIFNTEIGIVASGMCYTYAKEVFGEEVSYFKVGFSYPLPLEKIKQFSEKVRRVIVIEENDPIMELEMKAFGISCEGYDLFPYQGEKTPDVIRRSLLGETLPTINYTQEKIVPRPPTLCAGCPHRGFFYELGKRKNLLMVGDIGCYALAFAEPYNAMDVSLCMGGAFSMGHGAAKSINMNKDSNMKVVSFMGDSTFFHTGINSLTNVAYNRSNTVNVILDNRITGMTGHQENPGSGYTVQGMPVKAIEIEPIVRALGFEHVRTIDPNQLEDVKQALDWALGLDEPSVIITRWPCVLKKFSKEDKEEFEGLFQNKCKIDPEICIGCKKCIKTGCPALSFNKETKKAVINPNDCVGCKVCLQTCPVKAISLEVK